MTRNDLEQAGYLPYSASHLKEYSSKLLQKRFDDNIGKKYFITVYEYDNSWKKKHHTDLSIPDFSYAPEVQFNIGDNICFNVDMISRDTTSVEEMEAFFEKMWVTMRCDYYDYYEMH